MRSCRIQPVIWALAGLILAGPALAQNAAPNRPAPAQNVQTPAATPAQNVQAPAAAPAQNVPVAPDADPSFLTGLRRVGVMAGEVVECVPEADKQAQISQAMELANQIAIHFGLRAAFNFVGALGYGSGHPFDKAGCTQAIDGWKQIAAKYLNK